MGDLLLFGRRRRQPVEGFDGSGDPRGQDGGEGIPAAGASVRFEVDVAAWAQRLVESQAKRNRESGPDDAR
jgi:hypothetical protein